MLLRRQQAVAGIRPTARPAPADAVLSAEGMRAAISSAAGGTALFAATNAGELRGAGRAGKPNRTTERRE